MRSPAGTGPCVCGGSASQPAALRSDDDKTQLKPNLLHPLTLQTVQREGEREARGAMRAETFQVKY